MLTETLANAGFEIEKLDIEEPGEYPDTYRATLNDLNVLVHEKGDLPIVDCDWSWFATHGNRSDVVYLFNLLPTDTIVLECSDISCLVNHRKETWGNVSPELVRERADRCGSMYNLEVIQSALRG